MVHAAMLWLFVTRLAGELPAIDRADRGGGALNVFAVTEVAELAATAEASVDPPAATPPASELDASASSELPPEWSVARLPPAARRDPSRAQASTPGAGAAATEGVYDPFAGAAPMHREGAEAGIWLDEAALASLVSGFVRRLGRGGGSAEFVVEVSATGVVVDARAVGGSAPERVKVALRQALLGARLFRPAAAGRARRTVKLPTLRLG